MRKCENNGSIDQYINHHSPKILQKNNIFNIAVFVYSQIINFIVMLPKIIRYSLLFLLIGTLMAYDMPKGWVVGGSNPNDYEMGVDVGAGQNGKNAATIRSYRKEANGHGMLAQRIASDNYKGKRVRLSGYLKTKNVDKWAGLLITLEGKIINPKTGNEQVKMLTYDDMRSRFVNGTTDFTKYEVVMDVPDSCSDIVYGARLTGPGQIWFDGLKFETVGNDVPVTSSELKEPTNLDFDK